MDPNGPVRPVPRELTDARRIEVQDYAAYRSVCNSWQYGSNVKSKLRLWNRGVFDTFPPQSRTTILQDTDQR